MDINLVNWPAVVVAGLASLPVGAFWYARPVFGNAWMRESGVSEAEAEKSSKLRIFGFTILFALIMSANLAMFLADAATDTAWGATAGLLVGIWTFSAIAIHSLFELKSWKLIFINGGYSLVLLTIMGAILGAWR